MKTALDILTLDSAAFLAYYEAFKHNIRVRYEAVEVFAGLQRPEDMANHTLLKMPFLQEIAAFINGSITEDDFYNKELQEQQIDAISNIFSKEALGLGQFSFVNEGQLLEDYTAAMCYIRGCNPDIIAYVGELSVRDCSFVFEQSGEFAAEIVQNPSFISRNSIEAAYNIRNIEFLEANWSPERSVFYENLELQEHEQYQRTNYTVFKLLHPKKPVVLPSDIYFDIPNEIQAPYFPQPQRFDPGNPMENCGLFALKEGVPNVSLFQKPQKAFFLAAFNDDVDALKKTLKQNLHTKEAGLSAIHYAILGNAFRCINLLLTQEKYSKTGSFWLELRSDIGIFVPEGATCLWLCVLMGRDSVAGLFGELEAVECGDHLPNDLRVVLGGEIILGDDVFSAARIFRIGLECENLAAVRTALKSGLISPNQLRKRCVDLLNGDEFDDIENEILAFMRARASDEVLDQETREKLLDLPEFAIDTSNFEQVFGVHIGRAREQFTDVYSQPTEVNMFFDSCIAGNVTEDEIEKHSGLFDRRLPDGQIIYGFTAAHYLAYYGHTEKFVLENQFSEPQTIARFKDFDIMLPEGISVADCYPESESDKSVLADLLYGPTVSSNLHFYAAAQENAGLLTACFLSAQMNEELAKRIVEEREGLMLTFIFQTDERNATLYRKLVTSALAFLGECEASYEYTTEITHPELYNYKIDKALVNEPNAFAFNCDSEFFEECRSDRISERDVGKADTLDPRASLAEANVYHGMNGLFYAVLGENIDNLKELLPVHYAFCTQRELIISKETDEFVLVPAGASALHFAVMINSGCLDFITSFYQHRNPEWDLSYSAICISQNIPYNTPIFQKEIGRVPLLEQILYQYAIQDNCQAIHRLLESCDRIIVQKALTEQFEEGFLATLAEGKGFSAMHTFAVQEALEENFPAVYAQLFGCANREELVQLYEKYAESGEPTFFNINTPAQNEFFRECVTEEGFTQETFAEKGKRDNRPTSDGIITGMTGLMYCIINGQDQKAMQLFKHESQLGTENRIEVSEKLINEGTSPLKLCLLLEKVDLFEKICREHYDMAREEVVLDKEFIEILLKEDLFSQTVVQFFVETSSEESIVELIKEHNQTKIGQYLMSRLSGNAAFQMLVLESDAFSNKQKEAAKTCLFKADKEQFVKKFGEEQLERLESLEKQRLQESAVESRKTELSDFKESGLLSRENDEWFEICKTGVVKGNEHTIGSVDRRPIDTEKGVFKGFSGLFYAILHKNRPNIEKLSKREAQLRLPSELQLSVEGRTIDLPKGTLPIQLALVFNLEANFETADIPDNSEEFYLWGKRIPPGVISSQGLDYCRKNGLESVYDSAIRTAKHQNKEQALALLTSELHVSEAQSLINIYYNDKEVAQAFASRFGQQELAKFDLDYQKSVGVGSSTVTLASLFKAAIDRNFVEVRRLFFAEQNTRASIDFIVSERFVPRGSTIFHVLPFSSLDIVLWIVQRDDCSPPLECNRFGDNFLDLALQVNSNASLLLIDKFGAKYCETSFVHAIHETLRFENRELLDQIIRYAKKHGNVPYNSLYDEEFVEQGPFAEIVLDAFKCEALCQLLAEEEISPDNDLIKELNEGFIRFSKGKYVRTSETKQQDADDNPSSKEPVVFLGFRPVTELMEAKWRRVGKLVIGSSAEDLVESES